MATLQFGETERTRCDDWNMLTNFSTSYVFKSDIEHESESDGVSDSDSDSGTNVTEKSSGSDAMTSLIEGKVSFNDFHLRQAVAINVVSSFTEKSCHPDKPASVPTILIDQNGFRVSLYDCEQDILFISNTVSLSTWGHLSQNGLVFLWAVLNHR